VFPPGVCADSLQTAARKAALPWQTYSNCSQAAGSSKATCWPLLIREEKEKTIFDQHTVGRWHIPPWHGEAGQLADAREDIKAVRCVIQHVLLIATETVDLPVQAAAETGWQTAAPYWNDNTSTATADTAVRISCIGNTGNRSMQCHLNFHLHLSKRLIFSRKIQQS